MTAMAPNAEPKLGSRLVIKIKGNGYDGQLDAQVATLILDLQSRINRLARIALFGSADDKHHFSPEQKSKISISFTVDKGCSEIATEIGSAIATVIQLVGAKMTPEELMEWTEILGKLLIGGYTLKRLLDVAGNAFEKWQARKDKEQSDKHAEAIADKFKELCHEAERSGIEARESSARTFPTATEIDWGGTKMDTETLKDLRGRSPRSKSKSKPEHICVLIRKINLEKRPTVSVDITDTTTSNQLTAQYSEDPDSSEPDDRTLAILNAAATNTTVTINAAVTRNDRDEILRITILDIIQDDDSDPDV